MCSRWKKIKCKWCSLWHCSRYPMRTPLGSPGGDQRRVISVSDGLSSIRFMGGPGTNNSTNKLCLKCIWFIMLFQNISFPCLSHSYLPRQF